MVARVNSLLYFYKTNSIEGRGRWCSFLQEHFKKWIKNDKQSFGRPVTLLLVMRIDSDTVT